MDENLSNHRIVVHLDPLLKELIPGYLEHRQEDLKLIQKALEHGNYEVIERIAHVMKGSGGGYGFDAISEIGAQMEVAAQQMKKSEIIEKFNELAYYLDHIDIVYDAP